jgi:hypothetical protein
MEHVKRLWWPLVIASVGSWAWAGLCLWVGTPTWVPIILLTIAAINGLSLAVVGLVWWALSIRQAWREGWRRV